MRLIKAQKIKLFVACVFVIFCSMGVETTVLAAEDELVKAEPIYQLKTPFEGDGNAAYIDTELSLYDGSIEDWILIACISNQLGEGNNVFFSCFSEEEPYRGLLLRNPTKNAYEFVCGTTGYQLVYNEDANFLTIAVQKEGNHYIVFYNGEIVKQFDSDAESYDGSLLLGCQEDAEGKRFRFSLTNISELVVYEGTQSPSITAKTMEEMLNRNNDTEGSVTKRVIKNRDYEEEAAWSDVLYEIFQENGHIILLLTCGFVCACIIVVALDRKRKDK